MFAETLFPPLPSEGIMPLADMEAGRGALSTPGVIAAGTAGAMAGNIAWYVLARVVGAERLHGLVDRHGIFYVCLARLVPTLRSIVPIPAGLLAMPLLPFLGWSLLGTFAWTSTLTLAGLFPGQRFPEVRAVVDWGSIGVTGLLLGWYLWRVARWHRS